MGDLVDFPGPVEAQSDGEQSALAEAIVNFVADEFVRRTRRELDARRDSMKGLALAALQMGLETQAAAESVATYLAELNATGDLIFPKDGD